MKQSFALADILTVVTGKLLCPIENLYKILDFIEEYPHWTHELGEACKRCRPIVLEQLPLLNGVVTPGKFESKDEVDKWVEEQVLKYGREHELESATRERDESPIDSCLRMMTVSNQ